MTKKYTDLQAELDEVLTRLETEKLDIDEALKLHKTGQDLIDKMQAKLKQAKNQIKKLK